MKQLCLLLLVVVGLSQAVQYRRTISYEGELVARWYVDCRLPFCYDDMLNLAFRSNRLTDNKYQSLLDEPSVDVWKVDAEGRLDIRMSRLLYERLGWEECSVLHESVEELVLNVEKQLFNQSRANAAADWFKEYVRFS